MNSYMYIWIYGLINLSINLIPKQEGEPFSLQKKLGNLLIYHKHDKLTVSYSNDLMNLYKHEYLNLSKLLAVETHLYQSKNNLTIRF